MILRCSTVIILLFFFVGHNYGQSVLEKSIDFSIEKVTIQEALQELSEISDVNIAFSSDLFDDLNKRNYEYKDSALSAILNEMLQPYRVDFLLLNEQIILKEKPKQKFTIYGFVEDSLSGERLIGANVFDRISAQGTSTNEYGFFSLDLEEGRIDLSVTYLGYRPFQEVFDLKEEVELVFKLGPSLTLAEVIVLAKDTTDSVTKTEHGSNKIKVDQMKGLPALGGEIDVMRMIDLMPGIQTGNDGLGGIHVRGGNPDQNLVLLDGVPVYNAGHLLGVFSMFSDLSVQSVDLQKSNFDSRYGGRVSSVLDIRMREGDRHKRHGGIFLGPLAGKVFFEGPIKKDKSSFFISGRRLFWDWILSPLAGGLDIKEFDYYFYDWNAKVNFSLSKRDKIFISYFKGGDRFNLFDSDVGFNSNFGAVERREGIRVSWNNAITAIRWNRVFTPKLFLNATMTYSKFNFTFWNLRSIWKSNTTDFLDYDFDINKSKIQDATLRFDFDYYKSSEHLMKFGGSVKGQQFDARSDNLVRESKLLVDQLDSSSFETFNDPDRLSNTLIPQKTPATELNLFAQNTYTPNDKFTLSVGAYLALFSVRSKVWASLEPRIHTEYFFNKKLSTATSLTRMSQFLHQVSGSNFGLPSDLWVPSTDRIRPQSAWQFSTGLNYRLSKNYKIGWEAYYKDMKGLLSFAPTSFLEIPNWEDKVVEGKGNAYGTEIMLEKTGGKTHGWIDYSLSFANRQFDEFNDQQKYPFRYDRRHYLKTAIIHDFSKKFSMSASWIYGSGNPFTLRLGSFFDQNGTQFFTYSDKNEFRMDDYHRLDVGFNWTKQKKRGTRTWNISVYNVYNRKNPFWITEGQVNGKNETLQYSSLPLLPSFQYGYRF